MKDEGIAVRVKCTQCTNRILEETRLRNAGLCGVCHNWTDPASKRMKGYLSKAREAVGYARMIGVTLLSLFILLLVFSLIFIEFSLSLGALLSWFLVAVFGVHFFCLGIYSFQWAKRRATCSDEELFEELKANYLKQVKKANKFAAGAEASQD